MSKTGIVALILVSAAAGAAGTAWWTTQMHDHDAAGENGDEILYYRHPHDSSITSDEPRQDSMGMDYIPVYADEADDDGVDDAESVVRLAPGLVQSMNVRTSEAEYSPMERSIQTFGSVQADEGRTSRVDLRTEGWVVELAVSREGDRVSRGDPLFRYFSPALVNAQEEYLRARRRGDQRDTASAESRLRALGLDADQIRDLKARDEVREYVTVRAQQDGIIQELDIREGDRIAPGDRALKIADLSEVWVLAEVFEQQGDWLEAGLHAHVQTPYLAGGMRHGELDYVYPILSERTRTTRARFVFDNTDGALRPGMYARVEIVLPDTEDVVHVPNEAVIRTGAQDRVIVALDEGRFDVREVSVGTRTTDRVEVEGVRPGERVVTSGQFLIDSEANVPAELLRLKGAAPHHIRARGVIESIDAEERRIELTHEPIPALGWPEMTMPFELDADVDLDDLAVGDPVVFGFDEPEDEVYRIRAIERDEDHDPDHDHDHEDHGDHDHGDHGDHGDHDHGAGGAQ